ncbi:MAG: metalloregulator ArsR/SmtB family transcription factor [Gloeomargarita sp. DG_1_4_bins_134]
MADLCKIMADASRLQILWWLSRQECSVGEISALTGLSQANVSKHLQMLRLGNLVACRKEGNSRIYFLVDPHHFRRWTESLLDLTERSQKEVASCEES